MAELYPSGFDPDTTSDVSWAERRVFKAIRDRLPADWLALHSLWLGNHERKAHAEIDFVVITNRAVLLLEVKGGVVSRCPEGWAFSGKHGTVVKREGPFDQVRTAKYAVRGHFGDIGRLNLYYDYVWGHGVIFPDCILRVIGADPDIPEDLFIDMRKFPIHIREFVESLENYWYDRAIEIKRANRLPVDALNRYISPLIRREILHNLRPDFEVVRGLGSKACMAEKSIVRLTMEQLRFLDVAAVNERIVLHGAAGTGKTVLAFEQARRQAAKGRRVLFTCFNRLLSNHLASEAKKINGMENVDVLNYHQLVHSLLVEADKASEIAENWEEFNHNVVNLILKVAEKMDVSGRYDYLVVDEAQDLMSRDFVDVLDMLLLGGLSEGSWVFCLDSAQAIFRLQFDEAVYNDLNSKAVKLPLTVNCRNTRQIAAYVQGLASTPGIMPVKGAEGPNVMIRYYKSFSDYHRLLRKTVNNLLGELREVDMLASEITILVTDSSYLPDMVFGKGFFIRPVEELRNNSETYNRDAIRVGTVQSFKGLESGAVILSGLQDLTNAIERRLLYVGASRARWSLTLLLPERAGAHVQASMGDILKALSLETIGD